MNEGAHRRGVTYDFTTVTLRNRSSKNRLNECSGKAAFCEPAKPFYGNKGT